MAARYVVGIDLGTTNTVVAYADLDDPRGLHRKDVAAVFPIEQAVSAGVVEARALLPSTLYAPLPDEASAITPAPYGARRFVVGEVARRRGAEVVGRSIASSKSWLAHGGVDRSAEILPWGQDEGEGEPGGGGERTPRLSPIDAAATILAHVRDAWDRAWPGAPLIEQAIVLTVPASFDEVARALTVEATKRAGFPEGSVRLLEEPQAAFLDWARRAGDDGLRAILGGDASAEVLVCDVGGGTTDFSLIRVARDERAPSGIALERVAVGDHLLLGGDNMDIALAHRLEPSLAGGDPNRRLSSTQFAQLALSCRLAKERLLSEGAPGEVTVTLLEAGARLVGGARRATLTRDDFDRVVLDGFFPIVTPDELAATRGRRGRAGLVAFGLPYASEPAITRHLAVFLERSRSTSSGRLALLLNGGVFHAAPLVARVVEAISAFTGNAPTTLPQGDPDLAVARGAVAHGLALRGVGRRIGGGSAHGYYVGVATLRAQGEGEARRAVCVLPRGTEPGERRTAVGKTFALTVGRPARFDLFASASAHDAAGAVVEVDDERFVRLSPLATVIAASETNARELRVELQGELTEIGTLELFCVEVDGVERRPHKLGFDLKPRAESVPPPPSMRPQPSRRATAGALDEAKNKLDRVFGKPQGDVDPREAKGLVRELERILGERPTWPTSIVRPLYDLVREGASARKRSADHERVFWSLSGYLLRPGFGDPLDEARVRDLEPLYGQGLTFHKELANWRAWWIAWRRVAGGLSERAQLAIRDSIDPFLAPDDGRPRKKPKQIRPEPFDELLMLSSSLERLPVARRGELGTFLLERTWTSNDPALYAAIGRIGARVPAYASVHHVVSPRTAEAWLGHVLRADWRSISSLPFAATQLARMTGDRARDVSEAVRADVEKRLVQAGARAQWVTMVREVVALDDAQRRELFGEALPLGLRLVDET